MHIAGYLVEAALPIPNDRDVREVSMLLVLDVEGQTVLGDELLLDL